MVNVWRMPIVLGLASSAGLVLALLGDGGWDCISWFALGAPVLVAAVCLVRGSNARRRRPEAAPLGRRS